jgi:mannan endo-1,4-beta-mannosidase
VITILLQKLALSMDIYKTLNKTHTLFGQQDALAYGFAWDGKDESAIPRSDVKDVAGEHPALVGWNLGGLEWEGKIISMVSIY